MFFSAVITTVLLLLSAGCGSDVTTTVISNPSPVSPAGGTSSESADVIVYGATPSGIMAAIEAAHLGKRVFLLEPSQHIGGLMTNGLSATDLYGKTFSGLPLQFFQQVNIAYGGAAGKSVYNFEPHVAEQVFTFMLSVYSNITLTTGVSVSSVQMSGTVIKGLVASDGIDYVGTEYIDASYTGDVMAAAHVSFIVGRESTTQYGESLAGVGTPTKLGFDPVDPYLVPGNPASGLIPHVFSDALGVPGAADTAVMAYNYRLCVSSDPANQIALTAPADYDPTEFELLGRLASSVTPPATISGFFGSALPNKKFDLNNFGPMSTDEVEESFSYPNATTAERQTIEAEQKRYMLALLYFLKTDPRISHSVQSNVNSLGLCKDEFTDNGGWPHQLYVRESRRMVGTYVMTQHDLLARTTVPDSIGVGGYNVDDHFEHVVNIDGAVYWESRGGSGSFGLYPIPYRILTPQASQATNLLTSVAVSASHVAYDSLRVEVSYMIMGQAAGAAASLAIDAKSSVQNVAYSTLSAHLLSDGILLAPPTGTEAAGTTLTPASLTFDEQTAGTVSPTQILTLSNPDTIPAVISNITMGGTDADDFTQTNTCGSFLAVGASCTISVTFDPMATGARTAYVIVSDNSGTVAGSTQMAQLTGTGTASTSPDAVSLSPSSGTGLTQTFTAVYSDPSGTGSLTSVGILFNTAVTGVNGCYVSYDPASDALYLKDNNDKSSVGPLAPGSPSSLSNGQCTLNGSGTSVSVSDTHLTVKFSLTFSDSFTGSKLVYLAASDAQKSSGWTKEGTWTP